MKFLNVLFVVLICPFAHAESKTETRKLASAVVDVDFEFQTKNVTGGQVVCGYAKALGYTFLNLDNPTSYPATASVSCVFVPTSAK